ncbi:hypothetical protein SANTM175S_08089 [Streptomyces antimycoticus]
MRVQAATDSFQPCVARTAARTGPLLTAAGFTVEDERTITVNIEGERSEAIGRYAYTSLQRIRGVAAPALSPEDLTALDDLLGTDSPNSLLRREDLAVRTERTVWAAPPPLTPGATQSCLPGRLNTELLASYATTACGVPSASLG